MFVLTSTALAPGWFLCWPLVRLVRKFVPATTLHQLGDKQMILASVAFALLVSVVLLPFALISFDVWAVLLVHAISILAAGIGVFIVFLAECAAFDLVRTDIRLAKRTSLTEVTTLDPEQCVSRFELPYPLDEFFSPHIILTRRVWALIFYFGVLKPVVGVMGAVAIVLVLILPITAIATLGHDPVIGNWVAFDETPASYVVAIVLLWVVGVIALHIVAKLSVKLTVLVCGPWKSDLVSAIRQDEIDCVVDFAPEQGHAGFLPSLDRE